MSITNVPLVPRNPDGIPLVVAIGRISTDKQNEESIEASYKYVQPTLDQLYDGEMDIRFLGEQASGMRTDRVTIREAEDLVDSGKVDLVIAEDLSRIYRNPRHQYNFVQDAVDQGTRVICIGDNLDTADENWEVMMGAASLRHGLFIPDTRRRVRRSAKNAFHKGGEVTKVKYGYRKLTKEDADSQKFGPKGLRIAKIPECTPIIQEMRRRLMEGKRIVPVVEWLNDEEIPLGPYVKSGRWSPANLKGLMCDPLLNGNRTFRDTLYEPVFKTGKHNRRKNAEPENEFYPELAHLTLDEQQSMLDAMGWTFNKGGPIKPPKHPRHGIPRRRSIWPGQAATCAVCGSTMYLMVDHLRCKNSLKMNGKSCWNYVQVPVELTRRRIVDWLLAQLRKFPELRDAFVDAAWDAIQHEYQRLRRNDDSVEAELNSLEKQAAQLGKAIAHGGELETLVNQLTVTERRIGELRDKASANNEQADDVERFKTREEIDAHVAEALHVVAETSFQFADVLRRYFPRFEIQPVQALDTGLVRPRGRLVFSPHADDASSAEDDGKSNGEHELSFELFERPKHIQAVSVYRAEKLKNPKLSLKKMEAATRINYMTLKRASAFIKLMEEQGMDEPYVELHCRPDNAPRWR